MSKIQPEYKRQSERYSQVTKFLRERVLYWSKRLELDRWKLDLTFYAQQDENRPGTPAHVSIQPEYSHADIGFRLPVCVNMSSRDLSETVVHELSHCLVAPYKRFKPDEWAEEPVVCRLTRLFLQMDTQKRSKKSV